MNFNFLNAIVFLFCILTFLSCTVDSNLSQPQYGSISISFLQPPTLANLRVQENEIKQVTQMVITIKTMDGQDTDYSLRKVGIFEFEGTYLCENIFLPIGSYQITTLYLVDNEDNVLFASPQKDVLLAQNVDNPLPITNIASNKLVNKVSMELLSTKGFTPDDFGMESLDVKFEEVFYFFVALVEKSKTTDFLAGHFKASNGEYTHQQEIGPHIQKVNLKPGFKDYNIKIEKENYHTFEGIFPFDSLISHVKSPLVIALEIVNECIGGTYVGNVILNTQDEVDEFGGKCYTKIEGILRIGSFFPENPMAITDLGPLESILAVTKSLEIRNNKALTSLHGLHNLGSVESYMAIDGNDKLESLAALRNLKSIAHGLNISNNHAIINLDGLQGLDHLNSNSSISNNKNLINLVGLENVGWTNYLSIDHNESLISFQGLVKITHISHLNIANNKSLVSFSGLQNSIIALNYLTITNNPKLEDLTNLFSKEGSIIHSFTIDGNSSLSSLEGLRFNKDITFNVQIENNPQLIDISAMMDINTIGRDLIIANNEKLSSLTGFENLFSVGNLYRSERDYLLSIVGNKSLKDFCALSYLFKEGIVYKQNITLNAYNPSVAQMKVDTCAL